ncbi:hypothetical protein HUT05_29135 [Streptomyces chartreusis]|uniref:Uncharacterized protein n=2 Tax=Streptomyces chartreusis TaxID=1969 RepID=A0A7H8TC10_STRCX|nr:hypothetical protein HUT05_29135 [Streptomyces chartreusis]
MQLMLGFQDVRLPEAELRSLHMWLMADPAARRHARPALAASQALAPGTQGGTLDLVSLVVSSGFSAASLAMSVLSWRATRPQRPSVTVNRPGGLTITISASSADEAGRLIESLTDNCGVTREPDDCDGSGGHVGRFT